MGSRTAFGARLRSMAPLALAALGIAGGSAREPARAQAAPAPYRVLHSFSLPGSDGWDYLTLDGAQHHLYITRGTHVMVVNPDSGALLADLTGMQGVHGVALAGEHAYISDGGANVVVVVDRRSLRELHRIPVGQGPDGILFDPYSKRIFTFNGRGGDTTAIDVANDQVVGSVALGGKPEAAASDERGHLFVNIENRSTIAVIDSHTLRVTGGWPLAPCDSPSGIALDVAGGRLFSGCDNSQLAVSDIRAGRVVTTVPIGAGVDSNRFDAGQKLVFSSNGLDGTLTVIQELAGDRYSVLQNLPTLRSARTMEMDPMTHRVYLVGADVQPVAPTPGQPRPRPRIVPGTFRLLVIGQ